MNTDVLPEVFFDVGDDACDCTFQRIGLWTNPYIGETLEVRMCCIWAELYKLFPQHVRVTPAYLDSNTNEWSEGPANWDGETDMPAYLWYRQLSRKEGLTLPEIRTKYADQTPPVGTPRPVVEDGDTTFTDALLEMVFDLAERLGRLEAK